MITELTKEQADQIPIYFERWLKIGLATASEREPVSDEELADIVAELYRHGGLPPPTHGVVRAKSIMDCYIQEAIWRRHLEGGQDLEAATAAVRAQVESNPRSISTSSWPVWGCYEAGWCGWAAYMDEVLHLEGVEISRGLRRLAMVSGFCLAFDDVFIWSPPHTQLHLDENSWLHNETGPAVVYDDGFGVWAIRNHRVPRYVVEEPHLITVQAIDEMVDAETRRIMIERYPGGTGKWLEDVGAKVVDMDEVVVNPASGRTIVRTLFHGPHETAFLAAPDGSTTRIYFMPVDPEHTTCSSAHESIMPLGMRESDIVAQG